MVDSANRLRTNGSNPDPCSEAEIAHLRAERDLYRRLLDLRQQQDPESFLREALALVVEVSGAIYGYIELYDEENGTAGPRWWMSHGFSDEQIEGVRTAISRGIIAEALATGETIMTPSALLDPRFNERDSVLVGQDRGGPVRTDRRRRPARRSLPAGTRLVRPVLERGTGESRERRPPPGTARRGAHEPPADGAPARTRLPPGARSYASTLVIGRSHALAAVLKHLALVAPLDVNVLVTGESGTGKSQIARVIHDNGPRATQPFIEVNCATLPEGLVESELFGALPGAHSTATRRMEGKVAAAQGGTLFLDEIADCSLAVQAKLLHLLQSKEYYPLGGNRPLRADVRLIAATNTDLGQAVAERRFREDLLYRLSVLPLRAPSLAERREDIPELAAFFCDAACRRHGLPHLELSRGAIRAAESTEWPGNVRQLAHAIEAAAIRAAGSGDRKVERHHLFPDEMEAPASSGRPITFQEATRRFQAGFLRDALEETGWNVVETAHRLDLARSHVYNLIRAFALTRSDQ